MAKHRAASTNAASSLARRALTASAVAGVATAVILPSASAAPASVNGLTVNGGTRSGASVAAASVSNGQKVVNVARQYKGVPYRYGGTTPSGFDCSGFTSYVFRKAVGKNLPRTSSAQAGVGRRVPASQRQPGDLMWKPGHVGIYAGNGKMIHAPHTGTVVKEVPVYSSSFVYIRVV